MSKSYKSLKIEEKLHKIVKVEASKRGIFIENLVTNAIYSFLNLDKNYIKKNIE